MSAAKVRPVKDERRRRAEGGNDLTERPPIGRPDHEPVHGESTCTAARASDQSEGRRGMIPPRILGASPNASQERLQAEALSITPMSPATPRHEMCSR